MSEAFWKRLAEWAWRKAYLKEFHRHVDHIAKNPMPGSELARYLEREQVPDALRNLLIETHRKAWKTAQALKEQKQ